MPWQHSKLGDDNTIKQTKRKLTAIMLCGLLLLSGCGAQNTAQDASGTGTASSGDVTVTTVSAIDTSGVFSDRDLAGTYDEGGAIPITLNGDSASCDSSSVAIDGGTITIAAEGVYLISGTLNDGQIIVNAGDTEKVQLVLSGADITSSTSAAIYALEADKVFVTLAEGTENTLTNGGEYIAIDDNNIDAVIFAKTDLTLNGSGSLTIHAQAGHGVVSKDDLVITGGSYAITAASHGGTFTIDSADDCLHAGGAMTIAAGNFTLNSGDDAVHCDDALTIQSGAFTIPYCYEGIEGLSITIEDGVFDITSNDDGLNAAGGADSSGFGGFGNRQQDAFAASSDSFILINGGAFTIVSTGDCVDSNGSLTINGGTLDLTCNGNGDTALDCDGTYTNNGGDVTTNDGSESNPGQMGGGKAGMEGRTGTAPSGKLGKGGAAGQDAAASS